MLASTKLVQKTGRGSGKRPADEECEQGRRGRQGTAQVVEKLPHADRRDAGPHEAALSVARVPENPWQKLPVATRPAVLPHRCDLVVRRKLLEELDVGHEARSREDSFEEIVTEERILRHAAGERGLERVDVVDALSRVRSFVKEILVHVGDRRRVGIDARGTREDSLE